MGQALYIENEIIPFVEEGKELMILFRDHGLAGALPSVFITALENNCEVELKSGVGADTDSYTSTATINFAFKGQRERSDIPIGGDLTDQVSVLTVVRGKVAVAIVSASRMKTEFRTRKNP